MRESRVYLKHLPSNTLVEASLCDDVNDEHLDLWNSTWKPAMQARCAGRTWSNKPEDSHWDWRAKADQWRPSLAYHPFSLLCQGALQGLMLASDLQSARLASQFGKPLVYIEFLATAPWNRPGGNSPQIYSGVGTVFIGAAIQLSLDLSYSGRLGLHSLPEAERFYRVKCGMTEVGRDSAHQNLTYFEMTDSQADAFRHL